MQVAKLCNITTISLQFDHISYKNIYASHCRIIIKVPNTCIAYYLFYLIISFKEAFSKILFDQ